MAPLDDGWHINETVLPTLFGSDPVPTNPTTLRQDLCDFDIAQFGLPSIVDKTDKSKGILKGPVVLQLNRYRNVSYPKIGEANHADGIIRIFLSDGHGFISAIILEKINGISVDTPPGTKILLNGDIHMEGSFIVLAKNNVTVLGGKVDKLIEKWVIEKNQMFKENRTTMSNAPKWIPFGKRGASAATSKGINTKGFKANDAIHNATKKNGVDENDDTFDLQRKEQIEAAAQTTTKQFAAPQVQVPTKEQPSAEEQERMQLKRQRERQAKVDLGHDRRHKGRRGKRGSDDEEEVPSEFARPSAPSLLFDFLADSVPEAAKAPPVSVTKNRFSGGQEFDGPRNRRQRPDREECFEKKSQREDRGIKGKDGKPRENNKQRPRLGKEYVGTNTLGEQNERIQNRKDTRGFEKHGYNNGKTVREYQSELQEKNQRREPERSHGAAPDQREKMKKREESQVNRFTNGDNKQNYASHRTFQNAREAHRYVDKVDEITQGVSSMRMDTSSFMSGQQSGVRSFKSGRADRNNTPNYSDRYSKKEGPKIPEGAVRNFVPQTQMKRDFQASSYAPPLPHTMRRSKRLWKVGNKCLAPWQDGNLYVATVVHVNSDDMCTVRYDEYGNITTLPQGILIIPE